MSSHATGSLVFDFEEMAYQKWYTQTSFLFGSLTEDLALCAFKMPLTTLEPFTNTRRLPTLMEMVQPIIVINGGSHYNEPTTGIFVIGSESNGWQRGRQVWNQHAYNIVNINEDLSIPTNPVAIGPTYNNFRSGDLNPLSGSASAMPFDCRPCLLSATSTKSTFIFALATLERLL